MGFMIRAETIKDYPVIYELIKVAFQTAKVADGTEQDFAVKLRNSNAYIPELALVATINNSLVGHIMLTKIYVTLQNATKLEVLLLAPLAVLDEYRGRGIGAALINKGFELAKAMGYKAVFVCGDPVYYQRFGFQDIANFSINSLDIPSPYAMVCELVSGALKDVQGSIQFVSVT